MIHHRKLLAFVFLLIPGLSGAHARAGGAGPADRPDNVPETDEARVIEYVVTKTLTLVPVIIDSRGADPDTPWTVHIGSINVRNIPSMHGEVLGTVYRDDEIAGTYLIVEETDEEWLEIQFEGKTGYVSRMGFSRVHPANVETIARHGNLPYGEELVNRWWGIPLDYEANDLVDLSPEYGTERESGAYQLRREAADSLVRMFDAMRAEGIEIYVSSSYRSGSMQQSMFVRRMRDRLNQRGTAPPGHSEHQLGTTVDLSSAKEGRRALRNTDSQHSWLVENAGRYGWRQTYRAENIGETGYIEEPWHWRYMGAGSRKPER